MQPILVTEDMCCRCMLYIPAQSGYQLFHRLSLSLYIYIYHHFSCDKRNVLFAFAAGNFIILGLVQWGDVSLSLRLPRRILLSWRRENEQREDCLPLAKG
jgi:hypothetical protein